MGASSLILARYTPFSFWHPCLPRCAGSRCSHLPCTEPSPELFLWGVVAASHAPLYCWQQHQWTKVRTRVSCFDQVFSVCRCKRNFSCPWSPWSRRTAIQSFRRTEIQTCRRTAHETVVLQYSHSVVLQYSRAVVLPMKLSYCNTVVPSYCNTVVYSR